MMNNEQFYTLVISITRRKEEENIKESFLIVINFKLTELRFTSLVKGN